MSFPTQPPSCVVKIWFQPQLLECVLVLVRLKGFVKTCVYSIPAHLHWGKQQFGGKEERIETVKEV